MKNVWNVSHDLVNRIIAIIGTFTGLFSALSLLINNVAGKSLIFWMSILICIGSVIYGVIKKKRESSIPKEIPIVNRTETNFIRWLDPFEEGQQIIGRDFEIKEIVTKIQTLSFSFGYVSGEAGSGKTSMVRAGVLTILNKYDWATLYFQSINDFGYVNLSAEIETTDAIFSKISGGFPLSAAPHKKLIIIDQFEEFFILAQTKLERVRFAKTLSRIISNGFKILIVIRKEFVEDLRLFEEFIKDAKSNQKSVYVENWEKSSAQRYFEEMCRKDGLLFSQDLKDSLIDDLAVEGKVRPIELQIVCYHCRISRIANFKQFKDAGKSKRILATFIEQIINRTDTEFEELEIATGKFILLSLTNSFYETKRSDGGLSYAALYNGVIANILTIETSSFSREAYFAVFPKVLDKLLANKLLSVDAEMKYNLIHDYLVRGIREITLHLETLEQISKKQVDRYLYRQSLGSKVIIAYKEYRFIDKNLPAGFKLKADVATFLHKQKSFYFAVLISIILFCLAALTYLLPPNIQATSQKQIPNDVFDALSFAMRPSKNKIKIRDSAYSCRFFQEVDKSYLELSFFKVAQEFQKVDTLKHIIEIPNGYYSHDDSTLVVIDIDRHEISQFSLDKGRLSTIVRIAIPNGFKLTNQTFFEVFNKDTRTMNISRFYQSEKKSLILVPFLSGILYSDLSPHSVLCFTSDSSEESTVSQVRPYENGILFRPNIQSRSLYFNSSGKWTPLGQSSQSAVFQQNLFPSYGGEFLVNRTNDGKLNFYDSFPVTESQLGTPKFSWVSNNSLQESLINPTQDILINNRRIKTTTVNQTKLCIEVLSSGATDSVEVYLLSTNDSAVKLPSKVGFEDSIETFENQNNLIVAYFSSHDLTNNALYKISKDNRSEIKTLLTNVISIVRPDSSSLNVLFRDVEGNIRMATIMLKDLKLIIGDPMFTTHDNEIGKIQWSLDKVSSYFYNNSFLYLSTHSKPFKPIAQIEPSKNKDDVPDYFTSHDTLLLKCNDHSYKVGREFRMWGLHIFNISWP